MDFKEQKNYGPLSPSTFGRVLLFSLLVFFSGVLQSSLFAALPMKAVPDLILISVIGIAVYDGERSGAVAGIFGGVLAEALGGGASIMFFPVFYMLCGYLYGVAGRVLLNRNFLSWLLYMAIGIALRSAMSIVHAMLIETDINIYLICTQVVIPEYFMTFICSVPMYFAVRMTVRPFHKKIEME